MKLNVIVSAPKLPRTPKWKRPKHRRTNLTHPPLHLCPSHTVHTESCSYCSGATKYAPTHIKVRIDIGDVAAIELVANELGITYAEALGRLILLWAAWYPKRGKMNFDLTHADIDRVCDIDGFANAMYRYGLLEYNEHDKLQIVSLI